MVDLMACPRTTVALTRRERMRSPHTPLFCLLFSNNAATCQDSATIINAPGKTIFPPTEAFHVGLDWTTSCASHQSVRMHKLGESHLAVTQMPTRLVLVALAAAICAASGAECPGTGRAAPDVTTLMASPVNPASEAWIVSPDCSLEKLEVIGGTPLLSFSNIPVQRVESVPTKCAMFDAIKVTTNMDFSLAKSVSTLQLHSVSRDVLETLVFPPAVTQITIYTGKLLDNINNVQFPTSLVELRIYSAQFKTLNDVRFPRGIQRVFFESTPVASLTGIKLPSTLVSFGCSGCAFTSIKGVQWPASLNELDFSKSTLTQLEIRESDLPLFQQMHWIHAVFKVSSCSDPRAKLQVLPQPSPPDATVCVISDSRFEELYGDAPAATKEPVEAPSASATPSTKKPTKKSSTGSGTDAGSQTNEEETSSTPETTTGRADKTSPTTSSASTGGSSIPSPTSSGESGDSDGRTPGRNASAWTPGRSGSSEGLSANSTSGSRRTTAVIGVTIGGVCLLGIAFIVYRTVTARRKKRDDEIADISGNIYSKASTPTLNSTNESRQTREPDWARIELVKDGFENDNQLAAYRIDHNEIGLARLIAKGGYGEVYRGTYRGQVVAVKQMLPDSWRNEKALANFMDEIRMCASLDHPKIVRFIGVASYSVRDLSIVNEYMPGGDLHALISKYPESSGDEWVNKWTPSCVQSKALIASDVVEALLYLHSFETPIIHRDLKAKNVLLDNTAKAKLSDFGISREVDVTVTMTSEIGTAAWIAPEVLRGERYNESADIYSLGVLLVELDRCQHPFTNEPMLLSGGGGEAVASASVVQRNTRMILLVSSGQLRPSPTPSCPAPISSLINRCLHYDPTERPAASQVKEELHRFLSA